MYELPGSGTVDVTLFTAEEPLYLPRYLEPVFDAHSDVIGEVVIAAPSAGATVQVRRQLQMFGPTNFLRIGSRFARGKLLAALPTDLVRRVTGRYHAVTALAHAYDVPSHRVDTVSKPSFVERVAERGPDVILSIVCGQKLPRTLLDVPAVAVNLHGSLLPKYRGRATAFWPLYHGEEAAGVTAHLMTDEFDAGPIIEQRRFLIEADDTMHDLYLKLADAGGHLAVELLDGLRRAGTPLSDPFETRANPTASADYHTLPTPAQRREFLRRGKRFL